MTANIDEIYNMLSWDNEISIQNIGIQEAEKIKSLWVLIMPLLSNNSKSIWENCAKVLVKKSDFELKPYLTQLLKWLQDMNWPGSELIYNRLLEFPISEIEHPLKICLSLANNINDIPWVSALTAFESDLTRRQGTVPCVDG